MKRSLRGLICALIFAMGVSITYAQNQTFTIPWAVTSNNFSSTIAVTNTFQSIWAASTTTTGRTSCLIQNNGSNSMYVFFGPIANATTAKSVKLAAGNAVQCTAGGVVLRDQVSITGTSGDAFFAAMQ